MLHAYANGKGPRPAARPLVVSGAVGKDAAWARFDERVRIVERAYVERHRQQVAELMRRYGEEPTEEYLDAVADEAEAAGSFRSKAWQVALVLHGKPARENVEKVIDLREAITQRALVSQS